MPDLLPILFIGALGVAGVPVWVSALLAPRLRSFLLARPSGMAARGAAEEVGEALRPILWPAHLPGIAGGVIALAITTKWLALGVGDSGHYGAIEVMLTVLACLVGFYAVLSDRIATAVAWNAGARACGQQGQISVGGAVVKAVLSSAVAGIFLLVAAYGASLLADSASAAPREVQERLMGLSGAAAAAAVCAAYHLRERRAWRDFLACLEAPAISAR